MRQAGWCWYAFLQHRMQLGSSAASTHWSHTTHGKTCQPHKLQGITALASQITYARQVLHERIRPEKGGLTLCTQRPLHTCPHQS